MRFVVHGFPCKAESSSAWGAPRGCRHDAASADNRRRGGKTRRETKRGGAAGWSSTLYAPWRELLPPQPAAMDGQKLPSSTTVCPPLPSGTAYLPVLWPVRAPAGVWCVHTRVMALLGCPLKVVQAFLSLNPPLGVVGLRPPCFTHDLLY